MKNHGFIDVADGLGDSLRLAGFHHFCLTVANMEAAMEEANSIKEMTDRTLCGPG